MQKWLEEMAEQMPVREQVPLSRLTSFRIGGPADYWAAPKSAEQLARLCEMSREHAMPMVLIGKGSNILAADEGYRGLVIQLEDGLAHLRHEQETVIAGAGVSLAALSQYALLRGLAGAEFAGGIPGSLGGALYMNAGAYGGQMDQIVSEVTVLTEAGEQKTLTPAEMQWGYRTSRLQTESWMALEARISLQKGDPEAIRRQMKELALRRKEKQPLEWPSAGSTFKRPVGAFAGQLIEEAGLKGLRVGDAQVSEKHAGFIINRGAATAQDVTELIRQVRQRVEERSGIRLEPEVRFLGPNGFTEKP